MPNHQTTSNDGKHGLLLNITGDGKGKSTSAFGMVIRALGWGQRVAVLQFVKGRMATGESRFFQSLPSAQLLFEQLGCGLSWQPGDHEGMARAGWARAQQFLRGEAPEGKVDLLVLDELNIALSLHWLEVNEVVTALEERDPALNVVITGRHAPEELRRISDLVSEVAAVKHPFERGIPARPGLDF